MSRNDITGDDLVSKASTGAYREGWDRIFGSRIVKAHLDAQVAHIIEHGPALGLVIVPDDGWTFEDVVARLETVIFVTNKIDASLVPKGPVIIPYFVNVRDSMIARWHEIIVKHWAWCYMNASLDLDHPIVGWSRGFIDLNRYSIPEEVYYAMIPKPVHEVDRDDVYKTGLNLVRNIVGRGLVLWESLLWVEGKVVLPMIFPPNPNDADLRATLRTLIGRGILPPRS